MTEGQSVKQPEENKGKKFVVKVYLVFLRVNTSKEHNGNRKLISAKLTYKAAKHIQDQIAGSEIERIFVDKELVDIENNDIYSLISSLKGEN